MTAREQTEKSISQLLTEIGVSHTKAKHYSHTLRADCGVIVGEMDAHQASLFYDRAQSAA